MHIMQENEYLNRLHGEILLILDDIVRICEKHNLKYYLIGGTLLGAIRHKGFIPWDDDLDIVMPREDFEAFTYIYYRELSSNLKLEWFNTNPSYEHVFAKVCNNKTLFEEDLIGEKTVKRGIFVDIFPIDTSNGFTLGVRLRKKLFNQVNLFLYLKQYENDTKWYQRIILKNFSATRLNNIASRIMKFHPYGEGNYYSNFGSQYNIRRQTYPKAYFGDGVKVPFEDRLYVAPEKYHEVLKSIFGSDYMRIPPKEKRRTHYPIKVIFSNGDEIYFGKTFKKLRVGKD